MAARLRGGTGPDTHVVFRQADVAAKRLHALDPAQTAEPGT
jgi:hypothetical protein